MNLAEARRYGRRLPALVDDTDYYSFQGGLNLVDTPLMIKPGQLMACRNYEPFTEGGYERQTGYERLDGHPRPSLAVYYVINFNSGVPAQYPFPGDTITGLTSAATGYVLLPVVHDAGTGYVVIARVAGTFIDNEGLQGSGTQFGFAEGPALLAAAPTDVLDVEYRAAATEDARALIAAVPGSGPIRGVAMYKGVAFAIRDNVGASNGILWKSTAGGWAQAALGRRLNFDAGDDAFVVGETVTGGTSGATATVARIVVRSGDWLTDDAAGYLILTAVAGTFQNNEALTSASGIATSDGAANQVTLAPGGRYEFRVHNFYGHANTQRLYGVNGVGFAFEYQDDPEFMSPIITGMEIDTPNHLAVHKNQLWLMFPGGSIQKSGAGEPSSWTVVTGAAELGIGDEGTGFLEEIGGILFVFSKNSTKYIAGNEASGYEMDNFGNETGAVEHSIQKIAKGIYLDGRGFTTLAAAQEFGNFAANSVSEKIAPLVELLRPMLVASVVSRTRNRARFFFSDTRFITIGFTGNKINGFTTSDYGFVVRCAWSGEGPDGEEVILMGSDTGMVYEADRGVSFDGALIESFLRPVFHHSRSPSRYKRYRKAVVDVDTKGPTSLKATVDYSFADPSASGEPIKDVQLRGGGGFWNVANWNEFRWSAGVVATANLKLEGSGTNIGLLFSHASAVEQEHRLAGVNFHISQRRLNRSTA